METELLKQITHLVISLVIVLQIMPWALLLLIFFIIRHVERRDRIKPTNTTVKTQERR